MLFAEEEDEAAPDNAPAVDATGQYAFASDRESKVSVEELKDCFA